MKGNKKRKLLVCEIPEKTHERLKIRAVKSHETMKSIILRSLENELKLR